jgi:predicted enzyme related to lactoylglutathione lyase
MASILYTQYMHKSRLCYITIDVNDLKKGVEFWSRALGAKLEPIGDASKAIFQRIEIPNHNLHVLLQLVPEKKQSKTRMHIDIETDNVPAEVKRLEKLGAKVVRPVEERGFQFSVMEDPFGNEFCVLQVEYPDQLKAGNTWK